MLEGWALGSGQSMAPRSALSISSTLPPLDRQPRLVPRQIDRKSEEGVFRRGHQKAGTAGFTPHTMIDGVRLAVDEIAGIECSVIDLEYAVEEMQFFNARMRVSGIIGSRIQPDQHAHAVVLRVPREYFDVDTWRRFFPLWFNRRFQTRCDRPRSPFTAHSLPAP